MANKVSIVGDSTRGVCKIHGRQNGKVVTGANKVKFNNQRVARVGDVVRANCGHTGKIIENSSHNTVEGKHVASVNGRFSGTYSGTIIGPGGKGNNDV